MTPGEQRAQHPEENLLAAFAEQSLTAPERASVMEHLSNCSRCRDIVFLSRQAAEAETNAAAVAQPQTARNWRWSWGWTLTAGALATALVFASISLLHHSEKPAEPSQSAAVKPPASAPEAASTPPAEQEIASAPSAAPEKHTQRRVNPPVEQHHTTVEVIGPPIVTKMAPPKIGVAGFANGGVGGVASPPAQTASGAGVGAGVVGGVFGGTGLAQGAGSGGGIGSGRGTVATGGFGASVGAAPSVAAAPPSQSTKLDFKLQPGKATTVVDVAAAEPLLHTEDAKISTSFSMEQLQGMPAMLSLKHGAVLRCVAAATCSTIKPSSKRIVSLVSDSRTGLAIDAKGALFLSHDQGQHWTKVPVQWNGKAVAVSKASSASAAQTKIKNQQKAQPLAPAGNRNRNITAAKAQQPATSPSVFELRNKKGQAWLSKDEGQTWQLESE